MNPKLLEPVLSTFDIADMAAVSRHHITQIRGTKSNPWHIACTRPYDKERLVEREASWGIVDAMRLFTVVRVCRQLHIGRAPRWKLYECLERASVEEALRLLGSERLWVSVRLKRDINLWAVYRSVGKPIAVNSGLTLCLTEEVEGFIGSTSVLKPSRRETIYRLLGG